DINNMTFNRLTHVFITGCFLFFYTLSCTKTAPLPVPESEYEHWKQLIYASAYSDMNASKEAVRKAYSLAEDSIQICEIKIKEGNLFYMESKYDSLLSVLEFVEDYCNRHATSGDILPVLLTCYDLRAKIHIHTSQYDSILFYHQKAYELAERYQLDGLPTITLNLADAYLENNEYVTAVNLYRNLLRRENFFHLSPFLYFDIYNGLGRSYLQLRNFDLCNFYLDKASGYLPEVDSIYRYYHFSVRGTAYHLMKEHDKSLTSFLKAKELVENHPGFFYQKSLALLNLAEVYLVKGEPDSTRKFLEESEPFFREIENPSGIYHIETLKMGTAIYEKNWTEATRILQNAYQPDEAVQLDLVNLRQAYLQEYYEQTGRYKEAYQLLSQEKQLEDSLRNETVKNNVAEIELRYQQDTTLMNRNIVIARKESEAKTLKYGLTVTGFITFLLIAGLLGVIFYTRKQKEYTEMKNRLRFADLKMENIRNRISPHFIFNNLNRILHSPEPPEQRLAHLSGLIRLLRSNLLLVDRTLITLQEELDFVEQYIQVEKQSMQGEFIYTLEIAPGIDRDTIQIPSMMIQIPVENAVKHGLRGKEGRKELSILINRPEEGIIRILITDNGPGFHPATLTGRNHTGTGLKVIRQTIHIYNLFNKDRLNMEISNKEEEGQITGCRIEIRMPEQIISPEAETH
ncbi:MAG: histidine kinase, partial [Tannerellaceae bacterium]|nr:histidine kinase [Tannerellaceae bacterium]